MNHLTRVSNEFSDIPFLAQGTLYPDVIESGVSDSKTANVIKSHHNVGGLPKKINFQLIEPLRELFKDEVRNIGYELGLRKLLTGRHPFPWTWIKCKNHWRNHSTKSKYSSRIR